MCMKKVNYHSFFFCGRVQYYVRTFSFGGLCFFAANNLLVFVVGYGYTEFVVVEEEEEEVEEEVEVEEEGDVEEEEEES